MCPYYFKLEEVFLNRAGIKPKATTDDLFDDISFGSRDPVDSEDEDGAQGDSGADDNVSVAHKSATDANDSTSVAAMEDTRTPKTKSTNKRKTKSKSTSGNKKKGKKKGRPYSSSDDAFERDMSMLVKVLHNKIKGDTSEAAKITTLAKQFNEKQHTNVKNLLDFLLKIKRQN